MAVPMVPAFDTDAFTAYGGFQRWDTWIDDAGHTRAYLLEWLYNGAGVALVAGEPMKIVYDGDADTNPKVIVCTASPATTYERIAVPLTNLAAASWGWFAVKGYVEAYVNGGTVDVAKDDFLKVDISDDADAFVGDSTTRTTNSHAIYSDDTGETDTSASLRLVYLIGDGALLPA